MSANAKKEIQEIIRKLKGHGIEVAQLPNGHWRTKTTPPVTMAFSPSDTNAARAARRDIKQKLGIDITKPPRKRKDTANDFAMQRLRDRALRQMERGAGFSDLARVAVCESETKRIGGWASTDSAEMSIRAALKGGRLAKTNHDSLAAAVSKLESAADKDFVKHLDAAAEHFGKKRIKPRAAAAPAPTPPEPEPEPATHHPTGGVEDGDNVEVLTEEAHRALTQEIRDIRADFDRLHTIPTADAELLDVPGRVEVSVKIGLDERTLELLSKLLAPR